MTHRDKFGIIKGMGTLKSKKNQAILLICLCIVFTSSTWASWSLFSWYMEYRKVCRFLNLLATRETSINEKQPEDVSIYILINIGSRVPNHLKRAIKHSNTNIRIGAALAIGEMKIQEAKPLLYKALNDTFVKVQVEAAIALGKLKDKKAGPALLERFSGASMDLTMVMAEALGEIGYSEAVPTLIKLLKSGKTELIVSAARALGKIGDPAAVTPLMMILPSRNYDIQDSAARALEKIGKPAIPKLLEALQSISYSLKGGAAAILGTINVRETARPVSRLLTDTNREVRAWSAWTLGCLRDQESVGPLIEALQSDSGSSVRARCAESLGKMIPTDQIFEVLIGALMDHDWNVRYRAVNSLRDFGDKRAIPGLRELLFTDQENAIFSGAFEPAAEGYWPRAPDPAFSPEQARESAALALGEMIGKAAIPDLIQMLDDSAFNVRSGAATALGRLEAVEAIDKLIVLLTDPIEFSVQAAAAEALGNIGEGGTENLLEAALHHEFHEVRVESVRALEKIGTAKAREVLLKISPTILANDQKKVRISTIQALGKLRLSKALPSLIILLDHPDPTIKIAIINALRTIGDPRAVPAILEALKDYDQAVRSWAAGTLGKFGDSKAIPGLIRALRDPDQWVRARACSSLAKLEGREILPALIAKLQDPNQLVQISATEALGKMEDPAAIPALEKAADNEGPLARAAQNALKKLLRRIPAKSNH